MGRRVSSTIIIKCPRVGEAMQGKNRFEKRSGQFNVKIKSFRADNSPVNAIEFKSDHDNKGQDITLSDVGAHHQNGGLRESHHDNNFMVVYDDVAHRPPLLRAGDARYSWPFVMDHAVYCWNHFPIKNITFHLPRLLM
jgi:hypothetical protein